MQSRIQSTVEVISGTLVAYGVSVLAGVWIYPAFGLHTDIRANMGVTACFATISIARSYLWRRMFNWLARPKAWPDTVITSRGSMYRSVRSIIFPRNK